MDYLFVIVFGSDQVFWKASERKRKEKKRERKGGETVIS